MKSPRWAATAVSGDFAASKRATPAPPRPWWLALVALGALLAALAVLSLLVGSHGLPIALTLRSLWHAQGEAWPTIRDYRLPRTELAILVGAALGLAGCLVQTLTRNPLAGPGILGVNSGAGLFVVLGIGAGVIAPLAQFGLAFAGAAVVAGLVFASRLLSRSSDPVRLLLTGTALGASLESTTAGLSLLQPNSLEQFRLWAVGSVADRGEAMLPILAACLLAGLAASLALARSLDVVAMGDEHALALGIHRGRLLIACGAVISMLCGEATAAAGPIVFVGLLVPHLARMLVGIGLRRVLPACALLGAALLLAADILGRLLVPGSEIPAGAVSAVIGAPLFFVLMRRAKFAP
ncbi:FecCD family ABC transporter permease [Burkholderia gladioli]|uniref:FecCD family ABC transporter permease n=1 Tax=Burkholderia gladioli TaxID=28095 RepID=UPI003F7AEFAA